MAGKHRAQPGRHRLAVFEDTARWSPDPEAVESYPVRIPLPGLGMIIGRQGLDRDSGRLVEFAIMAHVEFGGVWREAARVDTCHETVHLHLLSVDGTVIARRELRPIYGPQDVDRGWDEGMDLLTENWEEHVRRHRRGR